MKTKNMSYVDSIVVNQFLTRMFYILNLLDNAKTKKAEKFRQEHLIEDEKINNICDYHRGDSIFIFKNEVPSMKVIHEYNMLNENEKVEKKLTLEQYLSNYKYKVYFTDNDIIINKVRQINFIELSKTNLEYFIEKTINEHIMNLEKTDIVFYEGSHRNHFIITDDLKRDEPYNIEPDFIIPFNEYDGNYKTICHKMRVIKEENNNTNVINIKISLNDNCISLDVEKPQIEIEPKSVILDTLYDVSIRNKMNKIDNYISNINTSFIAIDTESNNQIGYTIVNNGKVEQSVLFDFRYDEFNEDTLNKIKNVFDGKIIVGHNAYIDGRVINKLCNEKIINMIACTYKLSRKLYNNKHSLTLETLAARFNVSFGKWHCADNDSLGCAIVMLKMLEELNMTIEEAIKKFNITYYL